MCALSDGNSRCKCCIAEAFFPHYHDNLYISPNQNVFQSELCNTKPDRKILRAIQQVQSVISPPPPRINYSTSQYNKWAHKLPPTGDPVCSKKTDKHSSNVLRHIYTQFPWASSQTLMDTRSKVLRELNGPPPDYKNTTAYGRRRTQGGKTTLSPPRNEYKISVT